LAHTGSKRTAHFTAHLQGCWTADFLLIFAAYPHQISFFVPAAMQITLR
jgi:hypothetical protein